MMTASRPPAKSWLVRILFWGALASATCVALGAGAWMAIWMSARPAEIQVPDLTGLTEDEARETARKAGLPFEIVGERADELVAAGRVALQEPPAGSSVRSGRTVRAIRSLGVPEIEVPAVIGRSSGEARVALEQEGLVLGTVSSVRWAQGEDKVIAQHPAAGARRSSGDPVNLLVSRGGRERVYVTPDLTGLSSGDAVRWLTGHGLRTPALRTESAGAAEDAAGSSGFVVAQTPAPGDPLRARQAMTLTVRP